MRLSASLEKEIADCGARVAVGYPWWLRPWLFADVVGITLGRRVYLRKSIAEEQIEAILRHELVHVRQVAEAGLAKFLWRYGKEYLRNRRSGLSHDQAYRAVSFERDAFAAERDPSV